MNGTCAAPVASDGPTCLNWPPSSAAAFFAPFAAVSKYGLLTAFGKKATFSAPCATPVDGMNALAASPNDMATASARRKMLEGYIVCILLRQACRAERVLAPRVTDSARPVRAE